MQSPAQNRVTPLGEIVAIPLRGAFTGNRGILHSGHEIVRPYAHDSWLTCSLEYKGIRRTQWLPSRMTWLFFFDEAVSFAAGHRPCALCRRGSYDLYREAWAETAGDPLPSAKAMNRQLHGERLVTRRRERRLHDMPWQRLPTGTFVSLEGGAWLVVDDVLVRWTARGYGASRLRPRDGRARVVTPPSSVRILRTGYPVQIDASAFGR